jgi:hypothetical protein
MATIRDWLFGTGAILARLDALDAQGESIMANVNALLEAFSAGKQQILVAIAEERAEIQARLVALLAQLQALQDQIASGDVVTEDQMAAAVAFTTEIVSHVRDVSEPVAP